MPSDISDVIPQGYKILKTIDTSGVANEYIAHYEADDVLVRLKMVNFGQTSTVTTRRQLREYLRCDITFMEELELPGIIRLFDYSDTKNLIWIATQPAEVDKLSARFDFLKSQPLQFRQTLALQFLAVLRQVHDKRVVHRNLSDGTVFLSPESKILIGDFGFATYVTGQPTLRQDTIMVPTIGYMPPEVKNVDTFTCDVSSDIFSAGLLVFEILSADPLPKEVHSEINQILCARLDDQIAKEIIGADTAEAILKAANPLAQRRWLTTEDLFNALEKSLQDKSSYSSFSSKSAATAEITMPVQPPEAMDPDKTIDIDATADIAPGAPGSVESTPEAAVEITPLDPSHEIWNNRYEILEKIGEGGQAVVYKAFDHLTNEEIAIKTMWSRHRNDRSAINRLKQGAMIARSLTHPYIIKTFSVEQRIDSEGSGKYVFICMELIKSNLELSDIIENRRNLGHKIGVDETLHIIRQLLHALRYAHEHTIHRDVKPGNIMLVPKDDQVEIDSAALTKFNIRLIDFGIAKVLSQKHIDVTGKGFRSAHYGAPELADVKTGVDARADVYSAGVIMYQMLTMNIPRKGSPPANKANKTVPASLGKVIDKAINTEREKRFKTASEFLKEIDKAVSKFNWVRKAAKIAAVILLVVCAGVAIKYFIPEPDELPIQQSIELLKSREPGNQIAVFAGSVPVTYSDIEGYDSYDGLRQTAIDNLMIAANVTGKDYFERSYPEWKEQEDAWAGVEPAVEKISRIAQDQRQYNDRKDIIIASHLVKLEPSSMVITEATDNIEEAEKFLESRPLKQDNLDFCRNTYDLGAKVFTNIENLAAGSTSPQTATEINEKLKGVENLRNNFLPIRSSLDAIEQLKSFDFHAKSDRCFEKADGYYRSFALLDAEKYFNLLNQICATIAYVKDQVDFKRSDIGLISSRLMDLCNDDIETFENYPDWQQKLQQVHRKKEVFARYMLIHTLLSMDPEDAPEGVYGLAVSAKSLYEEGNLKSAIAKLLDATEEYQSHVRSKISDLTGDCDSLLSFSPASADSITKCRNGLMELSKSTSRPGWLQADLMDEYNAYRKEITTHKDAIVKRLTQRAKGLKKKIVTSKNKAQQNDFFWKSQRIEKYINVAQQYDSDEIDTSIENWKYVADLSSLSPIISRMKAISSSLEKMLERKEKFDGLAEGIDTGITFCEKFKAVSLEEKENYKKWGSELQKLRAGLTTPDKGVCLIDQTSETFDTEYEKISSAFSEIRANLQYHKIRVVQLIEKTSSLEGTAEYINNSRPLWTEAIGQLNLSQIKPNFTELSKYLDGIKQDVDDWSTEDFNLRMQAKCRIFADALDEQNRAAKAVITAIRDEKSRLAKAIESFEEKVNGILNDEDIRALDRAATASEQPALVRFRRLPSLLTQTKQKFSEIVLSDVTTSDSVTSGDPSADFEINKWFVKFNAQNDLLDNRISKMRALEGSISIFRETREMLAQQSSMETDYYIGLRDYAVGLIDHSDIRDKIHTLETDTDIVKMCNFLAQVANNTVPTLGPLKTSLASIGRDLTNMRSKRINTLSEAKDFNAARTQVLSDITVLRREVDKLNKTDLEDNCRKNITLTVDTITNLIGSADQTDKVNNLLSSLWELFPVYKDWSQWASFLKLYHITVSGEDLLLSSSDSLKPVNEKGDALNAIEIAADPTKAFYMNREHPANFGWPRYLYHIKDPTVILAFVPTAGSAKPFYMSTREITNSQYRLFLEKSGAKPTMKMAGWVYFGDQSGKLLIGQAIGQFPPSRITRDKSANTFVVEEKFEHAPITWVTHHGGQAYAEWLGAKLPTIAQHTYAVRGGATTLYPWGDELSGISSYAHVRSAVWQKVARQYNSKRDNPLENVHPPVGAVKDFTRDKSINTAGVAHSSDNDYPVWPCFTKNKANGWGLYDMIGNVWEWCVDSQGASIICGGSSLCPPEYLTPGSKYQLETQACDVGFRIIILAE